MSDTAVTTRAGDVVPASQQRSPQPSATAQLPRLAKQAGAMTVERWVGFDEMRTKCRFAAAIRGGDRAILPVWFESFPMPETDLSSTMVRGRLCKGLPVDGMLAPAVLAYIREEGLYA